MVSRDARFIEEDPLHIAHSELSINSLDESCTSTSNLKDSETMTADECVRDVYGEVFSNKDTELKRKITHRQDEEPTGDETDKECFLKKDDDVDNTESEGSSTTTHLSSQKLEPYVYKTAASYIRVNSDGKFECTFCHESFPMKSNVREHYYRLHCGTEQLQCPQCEFTCYWKAALDVHIVKCHTKRFTCERCGKMFPYNYQLKIHINGVHLNIRDYTCDTCGKCFKTRGNFDTHMIRHKNTRNFPCPHCDHKCRTNEDLYSHLRCKHTDKKTGEKPYKCDECGKAFPTSGNRSKHRKNVHGQSRIADLSEFQARQSLTSDVDQAKCRRVVRGKPQSGELDALQFPDNELVDG